MHSRAFPGSPRRRRKKARKLSRKRKSTAGKTPLRGGRKSADVSCRSSGNTSARIFLPDGPREKKEGNGKKLFPVLSDLKLANSPLHFFPPPARDILPSPLLPPKAGPPSPQLFLLSLDFGSSSRRGGEGRRKGTRREKPPISFSHFPHTLDRTFKRNLVHFHKLSVQTLANSQLSERRRRRVHLSLLTLSSFLRTTFFALLTFFRNQKRGEGERTLIKQSLSLSLSRSPPPLPPPPPISNPRETIIVLKGPRRPWKNPPRLFVEKRGLKLYVPL